MIQVEIPTAEKHGLEVVRITDFFHHNRQLIHRLKHEQSCEGFIVTAWNRPDFVVKRPNVMEVDADIVFPGALMAEKPRAGTAMVVQGTKYPAYRITDFRRHTSHILAFGVPVEEDDKVFITRRGDPYFCVHHHIAVDELSWNEKLPVSFADEGEDDE